jgi:WD40 repeat protein
MRELQTLKGHKKEVTALAIHPVYENLIVSGGFDGSIIYWEITGKDTSDASLSSTTSSSGSSASGDQHSAQARAGLIHEIQAHESR